MKRNYASNAYAFNGLNSFTSINIAELLEITDNKSSSIGLTE